MSQADLEQHTTEFMARLERNRGVLPEILGRLSDVLIEGIQEIEQPQPEDVRSLVQRLRFEIGSRASLRATCGETGKWCGVCPFGAFVPPEFGFSSETQPVCLPWIILVGYNSGETTNVGQVSPHPP